MTTDSRPTKKQRELLQFIETFLREQGYGPSYREVMRGMGYKSVSTVAVHIDGLIARGLLSKTQHSARSLELRLPGQSKPEELPSHLDWLKAEIARRRRSDDEAQQAEADLLESALKLLDPTPKETV